MVVNQSWSSSPEREFLLKWTTDVNKEKKSIKDVSSIHEIICTRKACRVLLFLTFINATFWVEEEVTPKNKRKQGVSNYGIERIVSVEKNGI